MLAGRLQDAADFASLFRRASADDLSDTRAALALMAQRQTHRQKDLLSDFGQLSAAAKREAK